MCAAINNRSHLCRGVPPWVPLDWVKTFLEGHRHARLVRVLYRMEGRPRRDAPTISSSLKPSASEEKPDAELDVTRLVEIRIAIRDTEDTKIIEIQAW